MAVVPYLHPATGFVALALSLYTARLGLRGRTARPDRAIVRRRHAGIGPWLYTLVLVNWMGGYATVRWARADIDAAASGHFTVGTVITVLFTAAALLSRRVPVDARARAIHPILGATALLLSGVQVFLGLQLLP